MKFLQEHKLLIIVIVTTVVLIAASQLGKRYDSLFQVADAFVEQFTNPLESQGDWLGRPERERLINSAPEETRYQ